MKTHQDKANSALLASAKQRTTEVSRKLCEAMKTMVAEIENNGGVYPGNKGRVTQAEVCRRAGVNNMTPQGESHKTTTKIEVDKWVSSIAFDRSKNKKKT